MTVMRRTIRIGNDKTGYSVPLVLAFATIAAMIVDADANPRLPSTTVTIKIDSVFITKAFENTVMYRIVTAIVSEIVSAVLNSNFAKYTVLGVATSWSVIVVPRSSSLTNVLDSPDIAVKKTTTQYSPESTLEVG